MYTSKKQLHKQLRQKFNEACLKRDKNCCVCCLVYDGIKSSSEKLDIHHLIDRHELENGGYTTYNGITLCPKHHLMAEKFHLTQKTDWDEGYHPDDLFKLINSSEEEAIKHAKLLSRSR